MFDELKTESKATEDMRYWNTDIFVYFTSCENHLACGKVGNPT